MDTDRDAPGGPDGLVDALVQAAFVTTAVLNRVAAEHDLSLTQVRLLGILRDRRLRMSALAEHLGLERSTLSGLVDRATARGLLTRTSAADDGRAVDVLLTADGAALVDRVYPVVTAALSPLTGQLSGPERDRLQRLLERLLSAQQPG